MMLAPIKTISWTYGTTLGQSGGTGENRHPTSEETRIMTDDAAKAATTYFDAWRANDFDTLRSLLDDDATFTGPLGQAGNADECRKGIEGLSQIKTDIVVHKLLS